MAIVFDTPVTAGTVLVRSAIQSPNYSAGASGWTVNIDGSVEFNNGTFRGTITAGSFVGTNFIINPNGAFFYSGTPAAGNLIAAISPTAGTDAFGNKYLTGISGITATTFITLIGSGVFFGQGAASNANLNLAGWAKGISGSDILEFVCPFYQPGSIAQAQMRLIASTAAANARLQLLDKSGIAAADFNMSGAVLKTDNSGTVDKWQTVASGAIVLGTGWADNGAFGGIQTIQYRRDAGDNLVIVGTIHSTSATPAATLFTLLNVPNNYWPKLEQREDCNTRVGGVNTINQVNISHSNGAVTLGTAIAATGVDINFGVTVPLGNIL